MWIGQRIPRRFSIDSMDRIAYSGEDGFRLHECWHTEYRRVDADESNGRDQSFLRDASHLLIILNIHGRRFCGVSFSPRMYAGVRSEFDLLR
ncbi:MAG: hypothetical protein BWY82_02724 [Verrucomicrobia bacterium ADurb.Bin474]|nr:MAG: hypothetical protein BWY82_02724 [Verrucomicrobia bacterium ADurb.Bin474]